MRDRRSKPRLSVSLDAVVDSTAGRHTARVTDLSEGGCYLDTVGEVKQGEIVGFRIQLPDDDWLYLEGEVRHHTQQKGFGVQFVNLDEDQEKKLHRLLTTITESGPNEAPLSADLVEE